MKMVDPEGAEVREEDEDGIDEDDVITDQPTNDDSDGKNNAEVMLDDGTRIVVSHPRRKNHNVRSVKKSPPTTPAKAGNENSSCLERRINS